MHLLVVWKKLLMLPLQSQAVLNRYHYFHQRQLSYLDFTKPIIDGAHLIRLRVSMRRLFEHKIFQPNF